MAPKRLPKPLRRGVLEQARGSKSSYRISYRNRLTPEEPTRHRESQRCIADVNQLHVHPPINRDSIACHSAEIHTEAHLISGHTEGQ